MRLPKITIPKLGKLAGLALLAYLEYTFGREFLGLPEFQLWGVPVSLALIVPVMNDTYVWTAFAKMRDVEYAMGLVAVSSILGITAHKFTLSDERQLLSMVDFACVCSVVMWRLNVLEHDIAEAVEQEKQRSEEAEKRRVERENRPAKLTAPTKKVSRQSAPTREAAREILLKLDSLSEMSNADLARKHGGTPEFWGQRKKALSNELEQLGA